MTNKRKTGWLFVLLLVIHCVVVPATAQQSVNTPNAEELLFQEAIGQRTSIFNGILLEPLSLEQIDALLSSKKISAEVRAAALAQAAGIGDVELVELLISRGANVNYKVEDKGRTVLMLAAGWGFRGGRCGNEPIVTSYPGNSKIVKYLLEAGARVDDQDDEGNTALMLAAGNGRSDSVKLLLEAGANIRLANVHGWTALIYAANSSFSDDSTNIKEIVKVLLASGADVNVGDLQGKTALDYASQAITELLISAGAIKL